MDDKLKRRIENCQDAFLKLKQGARLNIGKLAAYIKSIIVSTLKLDTSIINVDELGIIDLQVKMVRLQVLYPPKVPLDSMGLKYRHLEAIEYHELALNDADPFVQLMKIINSIVITDPISPV